MQLEQIPQPIIRSLVEIYYDFQEQRIISSNRIDMSSQRNGITDEQLERYNITTIMDDAKSFEAKIKKTLTKEIEGYPLYTEYMKNIYGIGPVIASGLIAYIADVSKFDNISKLWEYAGLGMITFCKACEKPTFDIREYEKMDGTKTKGNKLSTRRECNHCGKTDDVIHVRQRRYTGYSSNWNDKFKVLCWKIGQSIIKQGSRSRYRTIYDQIKLEEQKKHPEPIKKGGKTLYNPGHIHNMAIRKVIKIFLGHL